MSLDLPLGEWTELLIGDQWPSAPSLETMSNSENARLNLALSFEHYGDHLLRINGQNLAPQGGATAEAARAKFERGATSARDIASRNHVKSKSYGAAQRYVAELRSSLRSLAEDGNHRIEVVNESTKTLPEKIGDILVIITEIRSSALAKAGACAGDIYAEINKVLMAQEVEIPPRVFATDNGVGPLTGSVPDPVQLQDQIRKKLERLGKVGVGGAGATTPDSSSSSSPQLAAADATEPVTAPGLADDGAAARTLLNSSRSTTTTDQAPTAHWAAMTPLPTGSTATSMPITPTNQAPTGGGAAWAATVSTPASAPRIDPAAPAAAPGTASSIGPQPFVTSTTKDVAPIFKAGDHTGTPVSAGAEVLATAAADPVHAAAPPLGTPLAPTSGPPTPASRIAHAAAHLVTEVPQAAPNASGVTAPAAAVVAPMPPVSTPPINAGPVAITPQAPTSGLLGYGADCRPPAALGPAGPPVASAGPGPAPITPASGGGPINAPAVVRPATAAPTVKAASAAGSTAQAFGAATGAGAETTRSYAVQTRLHRLLHAVARQQPQLHWAIGAFDGGKTILVTDLAGGWIPADVTIPAGVDLLKPADRREGLAALLHGAAMTATYEPGQYLLPGDAMIPMSFRARDTAPLEDLGWELLQATKWREGVPRLAHTLTRAACAETGYLDSEVVLLREDLNSVAQSVLSNYPNFTNSRDIANWQLLAAVDSVVNNEMTTANYHFAWFRAQTLTSGRAR